MSSIEERVAVLEVTNRILVVELREQKEEQRKTNEKLDELLALRNKGAGAFWLATSLAGAGAISICWQIFQWVSIKLGVG